MIGILSGARQAIGQYFGLVSFLPSLLLVAYFQVLIRTGALTGPPDFQAVRSGLGAVDFGDAAVLTIVSLAVGVVMHPLQYMIVQLAEGYWGLGSLSRRLRCLAVDRHQRRREAIVELQGRATDTRLALDEADGSQAADQRRQLITLEHEAYRLTSEYPSADDDVMPTRLGNVLRRYEVGAGEPFGLPASALLPLVGLVAPATELNYLNDRRSGMDLAVRTSAVFGIAFLGTLVFFWDDGFWLLSALIPYALTYLSYRGAIVQAHDYGNAMANIIAMNRFALYERLRVKLPRNVREERELHEKLRPMLALQPLTNLNYRHPPQTPEGTIAVDGSARGQTAAQ